MNWKKLLQTNVAFVVEMCLLAIVVVAIIVGVVFAGLDNYTQHGKEITVPDICGMYEAEADIVLTEYGLRVQVIDSTYNNEVGLGSIVEQNPAAGSKVKNGRSIYVILNAKAKKMVPLPELKDMSQRQAVATLQALHLQVDTTLYEPSEFRGLVLDIRKDGISLAAGTRLTEGSSVVLVIGQGSGTEQVPVPLLVGKTLDEARTALLNARLVLGAVNYAEPVAENEDKIYYIYQQEPQRGEMILEGSRIDISLSVDSLKTTQTVYEEDEDDFFN